jgi:hypothetical protein
MPVLVYAVLGFGTRLLTMKPAIGFPFGFGSGSEVRTPAFSVFKIKRYEPSGVPQGSTDAFTSW